MSRFARQAALERRVRLLVLDVGIGNLVNMMLPLRSPSLLSRLTIRSRRPSNTQPFKCQCYLAVLIEIYSDFFRGCYRPPAPTEKERAAVLVACRSRGRRRRRKEHTCEPPRARTQLSHFGMTLGSLWDDFGVTLGSFLDDFGITLG